MVTDGLVVASAASAGTPRGMDVAACSLPPPPAAASPVAASASALAWQTAGLPLVLPSAAMSAAGSVHLAMIDGLLPIDRRVAVLLAADRRAEAFALAVRDPRPLAAQGGLDRELALWAATEQARLALPATRGPALVVGDDQRGSALTEVRGGLTDARELLPLPWPRWAGPLVVYLDESGRGIPPQGVVRPALPLLQFPPGGDLRARTAAAVAVLALDLSAPPAAGWPAWLRTGVGELARAKAAGEGPSPRLMRERRQAAGAAGLAALFTAPAAAPDLAGAVAAALLTPARRERFPVLLDLLRQGASGEGALRVAYGLEPSGL